MFGARLHLVLGHIARSVVHVHKGPLDFFQGFYLVLDVVRQKWSL